MLQIPAPYGLDRYVDLATGRVIQTERTNQAQGPCWASPDPDYWEIVGTLTRPQVIAHALATAAHYRCIALEALADAREYHAPHLRRSRTELAREWWHEYLRHRALALELREAA